MVNWRERLVADVFQDEDILFDRPDDFDVSVDVVLSNLSETERDLIELYYKYENSITAISKIYRKDRLKISRQLKIAYSHMRRGINFEILMYGLQNVIEERNKKQTKQDKKEKETRTERLGLHTNTKNALLRSGFETTKDIILFLEYGNKLIEIPGIGPKGVKEIEDILKINGG